MNTTLYISIPNCFTLFFNISDTDITPPLYDNEGRLNWDVVRKKREEIFHKASRLNGGDIKPFPFSFRSPVKHHTLAEIMKGGLKW